MSTTHPPNVPFPPEPPDESVWMFAEPRGAWGLVEGRVGVVLPVAAVVGVVGVVGPSRAGSPRFPSA